MRKARSLMRMVFLPSARDDLAALRRHYSQSGGDPAESLQNARRILTSRVLRRLGNGPLPGLRELPLTDAPFRLILRFQDDRVEVLAVTETRSDPE